MHNNFKSCRLYIYALTAALMWLGARAGESSCLDCKDRLDKCSATGYGNTENMNKITEGGGNGTFNGIDVTHCVPQKYQVVELKIDQCFWSQKLGCTALMLEKSDMLSQVFCESCFKECSLVCTKEEKFFTRGSAGRNSPIFAWPLMLLAATVITIFQLNVIITNNKNY